MRLPHHLLRTPHGVFYFQIRVPRHLQSVFGTQVIRTSLRTRDPVKARSYSYAWSLHYAVAFGTSVEGEYMAPKVSDILKAADQGDARRYDVTFDPATGNVARIKTDGTEADHLRAMKYTQEVMIRRVVPSLALAPPAPAPVKPSKTLGAAILEYQLTEAMELKENTREQRDRAIHSFVAVIGQNTPVREVTRTMASAWARDLLAKGELSKRTVANMVSHVAQPFRAFKRWGDIDGKNPVKGVVVMTLKEKRKRKKEGFAWEPFELDDLKRIFNPVNLKRKRKEHMWWAALIGLYTGARVGEVAQIFVRDFSMEEGVPCVRVWQDSDGQTLKTEQSRRLVPLHPVLLELGIMERVTQLRRANEKQFFPGLRLDGKAGPGNAISKAFSYYIVKQLGIKPRRANGIVGFHSLRKNAVQELQGSRLPAERRRAFVGHEAEDGDVHAVSYMRPWTAEELAALFPGLRWQEWLDVEGLKRLLNPRNVA